VVLIHHVSHGNLNYSCDLDRTSHES